MKNITRNVTRKYTLYNEYNSIIVSNGADCHSVPEWLGAGWGFGGAFQY